MVPPRAFHRGVPSAGLTAAVVLGVLALLLPISIPEGVEGASEAACLTFVDERPLGTVEATRTLESCATAYPDDVELAAELGAAYERAGDAARAEAAYRRALGLDDRYAEVRLRLARLLLARGAAAEARRQAETALQVQPNRRELLDLVRAAADASPEP